MDPFKGFTDSETFSPLPDSFFHRLLAEIDALDELKITLFALWRIGQMEGQIHFLRQEDFNAVAPDPLPALEKAVQRGSLLVVKREAVSLYFLNSPRGRASASAFGQGLWEPGTTPSLPPAERPNIFKLYEENIGPLTPLMADALKEAERTYPPEWVEEALQIAVKNNKRHWRYVEAILNRWKVEGHAKKQNRRNAQEDGQRYVEGEYADFIEH